MTDGVKGVRLTPDRVGTCGSSHTSNDGRSEMDDRAVLCCLTGFFGRSVWESSREVGFGCGVAVKVDSSGE